MERNEKFMAVSEAEKIRKAEEIYYRRNGIKPENKEKKRKSFLGGFIKNLFMIAIIIGIIYVYENKAYFTSDTFKNDVKAVLNTEINLKEFWNKITNNNQKQKENEEVQTVLKEEVKETPQPVKEESTSTYIMPLNGILTSNFGYRTSDNPNVEGNHTGIDIAGNVGDKIVASSYGKVVEVSGEGGYGNHLKIANGEMITLYAHCNQIYVDEGDVVTQGQEIAEVGLTGNTTGPHLHFEIRKNDEYLNPLEYVEQN